MSNPETRQPTKTPIDWKVVLHFIEIIGVLVLIYFVVSIWRAPSQKDAENKALLDNNKILKHEVDSISVALSDVRERDSISTIEIAKQRLRGDSLELFIFHGDLQKEQINKNADAKIAKIKHIPTSEKANELLR